MCDTLIPGWSQPPGGAPDDTPSNPGLLDRVAQLIALIEDPDARAKLARLLDALDSPTANLLLGGPPHGITTMTHERRVMLLRSWADSTLEIKRAGFQALKRLVHVAHYAFPTAGASHPAWRAVGYPGPLPHAPDEVNKRLPIVNVAKDMTLDCDVVIVGSGAGGGVAAGVLAAAGRSVIVLEKGAQHTPRDFSHVEGEGFANDYLDHGLMMTQSGSMPVLAGTGVGGGTVINYATSLALPDATRAEWDRISGLSLFGGAQFAASLRRVQERLGVNTRWNDPSPRDAILERGCHALGWHVDTQPRNVIGCPSHQACGYCGLGCRHNAKQSTALTYLADAVQHGARIVDRCDVLRVLIHQRRAWGVIARVTRSGGRSVMLTVRAKTVILAAGAIMTPALMTRSGVKNRNIGRGLRLHPVTAIGAYFDERVEPWTGFLQTRYSAQFINSSGYGARFETAPVAFALPASAFGWDGPAEHATDMRRLAHLSVAGILLRDRAPGRVVTGRDGIPRVHYDLARYDIVNLKSALRGAAELLAAAGAKELVSLHQPPVRVKPGGTGWLARMGSAMDSRGYAAGRMAYIAFHQMASCAMGRDPRHFVVDESGESHEVKGLYVADASAFPTSSGVNPMITIMALADHVARRMMER